MGLGGESMSGAAHVSVVSNPDVRYARTDGDRSAAPAGLRNDGARRVDDMVEEAIRLAGAAEGSGSPLSAA